MPHLLYILTVRVSSSAQTACAASRCCLSHGPRQGTEVFQNRVQRSPRVTWKGQRIWGLRLRFFRDSVEKIPVCFLRDTRAALLEVKKEIL